MKVWAKQFISVAVRNVAVTAGILTVLAACSNDPGFTASKTSESFTQDYNPHYLEVMWVVDTRSPMSNYRNDLITEAQRFFTRLDGTLGVSGQYKMGLTAVDTKYHDGILFPYSSPQTLNRGSGSLTDRVNFFGNIFFPTLNLQTDSFNKGFAASLDALTSPMCNLDARVPLVLVYLSYSDDQSTTPDNSDPVSYYANQLLALKNGNQDLLRVYAANYSTPLAPGVAPTPATRCALMEGNQIDDDTANYQARYFALANRLSGNTADLCQTGFSDAFDLTGLQLKTLPKVFSLQGNPNPSSIVVSLTDSTGTVIPGYPWTYDSSLRQISFTTTPPEGSTILVTYLPN